MAFLRRRNENQEDNLPLASGQRSGKGSVCDRRSAILVVAVLVVLGMSISRKMQQDFENQRSEINNLQVKLNDVQEERTQIENQLRAELKQAADRIHSVEKSKEQEIEIRQKEALNIDNCRDVFTTQGQGGMGEFSMGVFSKRCGNPRCHNACEDLRNFTGLSEEEFVARAQRRGRFHFEGEHAFWNPQSSTELAWYYATSVDYLFANVIHEALPAVDNVASKEFEPVLDYSGGVGTNIVHLASKGIRSHYFGIGMIEYRFTEYRVAKRNLTDLVEFKKPYSAKTGFEFDTLSDPLPRDGSLGAILAMDVLEHIPKYHLVVEAMVDSLRVGGVILEKSPFGKQENIEGEDVRVHLSNGGVSMEQAMGPRMQLSKRGSPNTWTKIKE